MQAAETWEGRRGTIVDAQALHSTYHWHPESHQPQTHQPNVAVCGRQSWYRVIATSGKRNRTSSRSSEGWERSSGRRGGECSSGPSGNWATWASDLQTGQVAPADPRSAKRSQNNIWDLFAEKCSPRNSKDPAEDPQAPRTLALSPAPLVFVLFHYWRLFDDGDWSFSNSDVSSASFYIICTRKSLSQENSRMELSNKPEVHSRKRCHQEWSYFTRINHPERFKLLNTSSTPLLTCAWVSMCHCWASSRGTYT